MIEPLRMSFEVACTPAHAFAVWTSGLGTWWPRDHTVTGQAEIVVLEGHVGGRIYERTSDGADHVWGEVTVWEPPTRLVYDWHIGRAPADATEVEIRFVPQGASSARVEIEHRRWDGLGLAAEERRAQNRGGWEAVLPGYRAAIARGEG